MTIWSSREGLSPMPEANSSGPSVTVSAAQEDSDSLPPEINTKVAHSARVYNYWLGRKMLVNYAR